MALCIPVFVNLRGRSYPLLPFARQVDWEALALFAEVSSAADVALLLERLLALGEDRGFLAARRQRLAEKASSLALEVRCADPVVTAMDLIDSEIADRLRFLQESAFKQSFLQAPANFLA